MLHRFILTHFFKCKNYGLFEKEGVNLYSLMIYNSEAPNLPQTVIVKFGCITFKIQWTNSSATLITTSWEQ